MDSYDEVNNEEKHSSSTEFPENSRGPHKPIELVLVREIKKRPAWLISTLEEAKGHAPPDGTSK